MAHDRPETADFEGAGWRVALAPAGDELRLEHRETGRTYVLDADGGLTAPGEGDVGADLRELQDTLASAVDDGDTHDDVEAADGATESCTVECDEDSGIITLSSSTRIELDAPQVDVNADGLLALDGGLITLN